MSADDSRFVALYRAHYGHVYAYCRRRVSVEETDDLVADVFLAAWRRIDDTPEEDSVLPWLYRVAYLTASNHWRGLRRRRELREKLDSIGLTPVESVSDQVVERQEVRDALAILDQLPPQDKEIIKLSVWEQLSHDAIASVLDIKPETARQRLHRAKKRLAKQYVKKHEDAIDPPLLRKEVSGEH